MDKILNTTIVVPNDDIVSMMNYCNDSEGNLSREFYDWYLGDEAYFQNEGMFCIEMPDAIESLYCFYFSFQNPDEVEFVQFEYKTQKKIGAFTFSRQENIEMKDIKLKYKFFKKDEFKRMLSEQKSVSDKPHAKKKIFAELSKDITVASKLIDRTKSYNKSKALAHQITEKAHHVMFNTVCQNSVYSLYATMYYFSKVEPQRIFQPPQKQEEKIKGQGIYRYTGYVNLNKPSTVYSPVIKKDPNAPVRDYERHIQAWRVRGHYRRTKNGLIWIEPHIKGKGEVENRIYGTEDEKDVTLIPKVFSATRTIKPTNRVSLKQKTFSWREKIFKWLKSIFKKT